ncbi:MAG: anthranilate phosphoribosyltransferase [Micropruina sp.]|nr:anthranilate phosphoribosyltransferase [Micropruina sp.]
MTHSWPEVLSALVRGDDLSLESAAWAMGEILAGNATPVQIAGFAVALRAKGETVDELAGLSGAMLDAAQVLRIETNAVDVVGSGGDRANTVNVSTMAAIVAAGAGAKVVKHGNRAASSACGTADCLEALGVALDVAPAAQASVLASSGIVFMFAPLYHPALRHAGAARRELGIPTTFNFLGPLANPARPAAQAVGVSDLRVAQLVAGVLAGRGTRGLVFHGDDGLDELTTTASSDVWLIADAEVVQTRLDPTALGLQPASPQDLRGADAEFNAGVVRAVLDGETGPVRDIVVLNAAAALLAYHGPQPHLPLVPQLRPHVAAAAAAIDSGSARATLDRWVTASQAAPRA